MRRLLVAGAACALAAFASAARAEDPKPYPDRPIRLVVPGAPGTGDIVPRLIAGKLSSVLGQPIVLENRPGASFNIASEVVARSPADGYTVLYSTSVITLLPFVMGPTAVDPLAAFTPVVKLLAIPVLVVANPASGPRSIDELVARARAQPGKLAYASTGIGSLPHLVASMLSERAGLEMIHVPYASTGLAAANVAAGEPPIFFTFFSQVQSQLASGALIPLAVASARRTPVLPGVATFAELGFPGIAVEPWAGIFVPAGTPTGIVERLNRETNAILAMPDVRERFAQMGMEPLGSTPERFAADMRAQVAGWPAIVKAAGITRD